MRGGCAFEVGDDAVGFAGSVVVLGGGGLVVTVMVVEVVMVMIMMIMMMKVAMATMAVTVMMMTIMMMLMLMIMMMMTHTPMLFKNASSNNDAQHHNSCTCSHVSQPT